MASLIRQDTVEWLIKTPHLDMTFQAVLNHANPVTIECALDFLKNRLDSKTKVLKLESRLRFLRTDDK